MSRYTVKEEVLDSEEELSFSSEEDCDSDDERFDPAEDISTRCYDECDGENDQAPARKKAKTNKQARSGQSTISFLPAREPGPQLSSSDPRSPMSLFKQFFSESAVSTLCHNTNAQAAKAIADGCKYKWTDVSVSEMYRYIGLIFYMATVKLPSIRDYWRQGSIFSVPFPAAVMSRDRYRTISWNVHMSHPDADRENDRKRGTSKHDHLFRVKPLMDTIRNACKAIYHPRRNLAVDERTVACRANVGKKAKPTKLGFKLFVLADVSNGYTMDFSVHTGKTNSNDAVSSLKDCKVLGSGYRVSVCSTSHSASTRETVQRRLKSQGTPKTKPFPSLAPIHIDLSDQLLQYYTAQHKTMKWYRKVFLHFLDIAASNSFIVHKELYGNLSHKEFVDQLVTELCGVAQNVAPQQISCDHLPVPGAELTKDVRNVASVGRKSCVHCKAVHGKKQKTPWKCQACDVHLCLQLNRNCFQEWHRFATVCRV